MKVRRRRYNNGGGITDPPKLPPALVVKQGGTTSDSLALYNAMIMQQEAINKLRLATGNKPGVIPKPKIEENGIFDDSISESGSGIDYLNFEKRSARGGPILTSGFSEEEKNKAFQGRRDFEEYHRKEKTNLNPSEIGSELAEEYLKLQFDDPVRIGVYNDADILHSKIKPIGTIHDGIAASPLYAPPSSVKDINRNPDIDKILTELYERELAKRSPSPEKMNPLPIDMESLDLLWSDYKSNTISKPQLMKKYLDANLVPKTGDRFKKFVNLKKDNKGLTRGVYDSANPSELEAPELYKARPVSEREETKFSFKGGGKMKAIKR